MNTLEDKISSIQKKLAMIETYRVLGEWLNSALPGVSDDFIKKFSDEDVLLTVCQELAQYVRQRAEMLADGVDISLSMFTVEDVEILKSMVNTVKSKNFDANKSIGVK